MDSSRFRRPLWVFASALLLAFSGLAAAEPPTRAARLGYISGTVSFSPAGQPDWVRASFNRPLTTGDRLWTSSNARAELQIGGAAIRLGPSTSVVVLNLDDRIAQLQLTQGSLKLRVRGMGQQQSIEVATPNLAFTLRRAGEYRVEADPQDDATAVMVQSGQAEVYGEGASYTVAAGQSYRFYGNDLSDYEPLSAQRDDDLDQWSRQRDRIADRSVSASYVSAEVVGYEDLDANGVWRVDANYGNVWTPSHVAAGWTPYRDGHWAWVDPWGWTWVDDAPWGFAVSHYGRWANINGSWCWVPGPRRERAVYAPALVAFVGGKDFQISASIGGIAAAIGWFPLAPREVYQPAYPVSRGYFDSINRSNAVIPAQTITKIYNTTNVTNNTTIVNNTVNVVYANQQITGAVVAVPAQAFVQSQPVAKATVRVRQDLVASAPIARVASVAPVQQSVQGGAVEALSRPPQRAPLVVVRTAPPPPAPAFAAQLQQLAAKPGAPIDESQRTQLKPAAPAVSAPKINVVAEVKAPALTALPPATPPAGKTREERKAAASRADTARGEARPSNENQPAAAKAEAAAAIGLKPEAPTTEPLKAAASQAEAARAADEKAAAAKAATAKADTAKAEAVKAEEVKADAAKAANAKADAAKVEAAKADAARAEAGRAASAKAEAGKAEEVKADAAKAAAAKTEAARAEAGRADAARAEAARAANAKAEAGRAEEVKADAAKAANANAKAEAGRADAARAANAKAEAGRAEEVKAETARAAMAQAQAVRAAAARAAPAREAASPLPQQRASAPRSEPDANAEDERKKAREERKH